MKYYTYAYLRKDGTPYYIGKGKGDRAHQSAHSVKVPKDKSRILFLKKNLSEEEAYKHEKYMIFVLGRKDIGTGMLRNLTSGGEGNDFWKGKKRSEEDRLKMRKAQLGKKMPAETKEKIRNSLLRTENKHRKPIVLRNIKTGDVKSFISQAEAARHINGHQANVWKLSKNKIKTLNGWTVFNGATNQ
jgi:hypothetical protein